MPTNNRKRRGKTVLKAIGWLALILFVLFLLAAGVFLYLFVEGVQG